MRYSRLNIVFLFLYILIISIVAVLVMSKNNTSDETGEISVGIVASGNLTNVGCVSVNIIDESTENEYSFDNGKTWQRSNYGTFYENGTMTLLARNVNNQKEIIFKKELTVDSIVPDAPIIKFNSNTKVGNTSDSELLKDVTVTVNNTDILSTVRMNVLENLDGKALVSYLAEYNDKKCYLLRQINLDRTIVVAKNADDDKWTWPTNKPYQISRGISSTHKGLDIYGPKRGTPIYAALDGEVISITSNSSSGFYVILKHSNGYYTRYAHMQNTSGKDNLKGTGSATKYIKEGQKVKAGQQIGELGSSGHSTGVHLHFEIWDGMPFKSKYYNPLKFVK